MKKCSLILLLSACMAFSACANTVDDKPIETSVITSEEKTENTEKETEASQTQAPETSAEEQETTQNDITAETETAADMTEELTAEVSRLLGALDYIDRIGGGNIPKDENDTIEQDGKEYAKVAAQFENTADLKEFIEENLTDSLIQNRYSGILGGDEPYYIDVDGALYGYVTAKGCGYVWIMENGEPIITVTDVKDDSFTAVTKFDNFGGESEMTLNIVFSDGFWKINSISYDGMTF